MDLTRRAFLTTSAAGIALLSGKTAAPPPEPYGPLPSERQIQWSELEFYNFLHFSINTFTDKEWGYGDEDTALFNPTSFDAHQIIQALKDGGSKAVILTCKHHDGFCLWPTKTTERSIKNSPYRGGRGDIVRELSEAARHYGLRFGVYLSPWDRSQPTYGSPTYIQIYREQLRELLTRYGPIFEIWHDGANGGDGNYGGAREKRIIDKLHYYDWDRTWQIERELQPGAVLFSDVGPDVRWVGDEKGIAGNPCWQTFTPLAPDGSPASPGNVRDQESTSGTRNGKFWMPAECDVSIRPGWFWHGTEDTKVKSAAELLTLYYDSVGRGASFLLNVPPDRRGQIAEADQASLHGFAKLINNTFARDLAREAKSIHASNVRGGDPAFDPRNLLDGNRDTYWSTDNAVTTPEVVIDFPGGVKFNLVRLREKIDLGQRIAGFSVDVWIDQNWRSCADGASIGSCRILRTDTPIVTTRLRLRINDSPVCPALAELSLFLEA